ncbi:acyl-CoA thioesterase [Nocardia tenerifensis]|uniref:Acyl-CoA thioesterase n=1 Tax=Nocardia tenerifensis TaxID=228006 RepID=A0A318KF91_9NOCA|nr:thioesterase family protein [Nocardia tenerifensis]PXX70902.1 acyl-CoA thioesterase [Nocardia tenerifensis]
MMQLTGRSVGETFALTETDYRVWHAHVDRDWRGWTGPHGGVIAALLVEVARRAGGGELPVRAFDQRFLGRPAEGAFTFRATTHAVGRSTTVVDVQAAQESGVVASASVVFGRAVPSGVTERAGVAAPEVRAPEQCESFALPREIIPAAAHFDIRPAAGPLPLSDADETMMCAWIELVPGMPTDAATLAIFADALPPAFFPTLTAPVAVPTVALSMHLHTDLLDPVPQPVLVRTTNASTGGGWSVDDIDLWGRDGRILASARQTRRVLG